jgi:hypothetical protein
MSLVDILKGRRNVVNEKSVGLNLTTEYINRFENRTFTLRGLKIRYRGLRREKLLKLIQEELDSMLILYRYTTKVKTYTDRKGISQVQIRLIGEASAMDRYNPLNIELDVATETPYP